MLEYVTKMRGKIHLERIYLKRPRNNCTNNKFQKDFTHEHQQKSNVEMSIYTKNQIKQIFIKWGFSEVSIINDWYNESSMGKSPCFLLVAKKP